MGYYERTFYSNNRWCKQEENWGGEWQKSLVWQCDRGRLILTFIKTRVNARLSIVEICAVTDSLTPSAFPFSCDAAGESLIPQISQRHLPYEVCSVLCYWKQTATVISYLVWVRVKLRRVYLLQCHRHLLAHFAMLNPCLNPIPILHLFLL